LSKGSRDRAESARRIVQQQKAADKRRTITLWTSVVVVVVLVIAGFIGYATLSKQDSESTGALVTPSAAVDDGTAFAVGTGPVTVDVYEDFMCPICGEFEKAGGVTLQQLAQQNKVTVRYHPIAILDRYSNGKEYSTRSAGAAAAAAEGGKFLQYHDALFASQPEENSDGLTDAKLVDLGKSVGLTDAAFADAVTEHAYTPWATKVTATASDRGVTGTPTVRVAGKAVTEENGGPPTAVTLTAAISAAAG
jgi:protein-disulfide isomerase